MQKEVLLRDPTILCVKLIGCEHEIDDITVNCVLNHIFNQNHDDAFIYILNKNTVFFYLHPNVCPRIAHTFMYDHFPATFRGDQLLYKHKYGLSKIVGDEHLNQRLKDFYSDAFTQICHVNYDASKHQFIDSFHLSKRIHPVDKVVKLKEEHEKHAYRYTIHNKNVDKRGTQRAFVKSTVSAFYVHPPTYAIPASQESSKYPNYREEFPVQATDGPYENVDFHLAALTTNLELDEPSTAQQHVPCRHPDYVTERARRETFSTWPHDHDVQNVDNLVKYGFFYTGPADLVRCYQCGLGLRDWSHVEDPVLEHVRHSPECPHLADTVPREQLQQFQAAVQGLHTHTADTAASHHLRHPEYKGLQTRIHTFARWPTHLVQTPQQLAEAGFYYTGLQDQVRCFSCDGGLQHWDTEDEPWIEHARWFPHCQHVRTMKGQPYIRLVQLALQETDDTPELDFAASSSGYNAEGAASGGRESDDPIYSPDAQSVIINCGFSKAAVKIAIQECAEKKIRWNSNILADLLYDKQARGEVLPTDSPRPESPVNAATNIDVTSDDAVALENKRLLKRMLCILCEERDTNILFLPCAHHKMCAQCAADVTMCPVCGKTVKEKVKTYMA